MKSLTEKLSGRQNACPVKIINTDSVSIMAAERVIYKVNGVNTSFSEMMGLPDSQLDTTYWLPWYNNVDLDTQLRFANVSDSASHGACLHRWRGDDGQSLHPGGRGKHSQELCRHQQRTGEDRE